MKKILSLFFSMAATSFMLLIFAASVGYATFIENDFGTAAARSAVYDARWFEVLLALLSINLVGSLFKYNSLKNRKWAIVLFHLSFLIIILGAGITRYFGYEGMMHIREGQSTNIITTNSAALNISLYGKQVGSQAVEATLGNEALEPITLDVDGKKMDIKQMAIVYNAARMAKPTDNGKPTVYFITSDSIMQYKRQYMQEGEKLSFGNVDYSFQEGGNANIVFQSINDTLYFKADRLVLTAEMKTMKHEKLGPDTLHKVLENTIYQYGMKSFLLKLFYPKANVEVVSMTGHSGDYPLHGLKLNLRFGDEAKEMWVFGGTDFQGEIEKIEIGGKEFNLSYGPGQIELPFEIKLNDFILDRYVNSMSPSSFKSKIELIDKADGVHKPFEIFMNNILNYKGFRFFQSSYDNDEGGTILSVNYDPIGTFVTYIGYFLMTLGMFLALFSKGSHFRSLLKKTGKPVAIISFFMFLGFNGFSQKAEISPNPPVNMIDHAHAKKFEQLLIADPNGRVKPVNTLASEVLRKVMKGKPFEGYTATEQFMSMILDQASWENVKMIKVSNDEIKQKFGFTGDYLSIVELMFPNGEDKYLLKDIVDQSYNKSAKERTKYDKEIMKLDERANLCVMVYTGTLLHFFPVANDTTGKWIAVADMQMGHDMGASKEVLDLFTDWYGKAKEGMITGKWENANIALDKIFEYQKINGKNHIPTESNVKAEIFYNKSNFFSHASKAYIILGFILLISLFVKLLNPSVNPSIIIKISLFAIILIFALHTAFLGLRWYISGHAPWSNSYETTLFIAWATVLAGLSFAKKSPISLSLTAILASILILITNLSTMDPEITNLVPVLKSYWLVIHVAVITSSYGFFAMAFLMGFLNIMLLNLISDKNWGKLMPTVNELSNIIEMAVIIGIYLLTIGTFLGAVWANESWGRYWGWDPKETWALVTVLVYTILSHLRHVPGMNNSYVVSAGGVIGFASVLMTYFGVNYFLSGMHSYAAGDAFAIPLYAKMIVLFIILVVVSAGLRFPKIKVAKDNA